jgi:AcrR family transcriptional regulator
MMQNILQVALDVMREQGVSALNMNEVARRVNMRPQSLSEYFQNKNAVYDALAMQAIPEMLAAEVAASQDHPPGFARLQAWFDNRIAWAERNPILYHLMFDAPVPGWRPCPEIGELYLVSLNSARALVAEAIEDGVIDPQIPLEQAADLLLCIRRGLIAERVGKRDLVSPGRFEGLVPVVMRMIELGWAPSGAPDSRRDRGPRGGGASG